MGARDGRSLPEGPIGPDAGPDSGRRARDEEPDHGAGEEDRPDDGGDAAQDRQTDRPAAPAVDAGPPDGPQRVGSQRDEGDPTAAPPAASNGICEASRTLTA